MLFIKGYGFTYCFIIVVSLILQPGIQSGVINLHSKSMTIDGEYNSDKLLYLTCEEFFEGNGVLKSPVITIVASRFAFNGTIHCTGTCTITAKESFNEKIFKREGGGQFIITIDPQLNFRTNQSVAS